MSSCPKPFLDVLNPLVTPQATHQEKLNALRAIEDTLISLKNLEDAVEALLDFEGIAILKPYLRDDDFGVVLDVSWMMSQIAYSEDCKVLIEFGIHEDLGRLLDHPSEDVIEQAAWGLGNIALKSVESRDTLLRCGISDKICVAFERTEVSFDLRERRAWLITNLCYGKPRPAELYLTPIYKTLRTAILTLVDGGLGSADSNTWLSEVLLAVSYLSDGNVQRCLDYELPQLVLKLCLQMPKNVPEISASKSVQRPVASEQLGEVLSYLPRDDLVRLCVVSKEVFIASVCDHKKVYKCLRPNHILATHEMRSTTMSLIGDLLSHGDAQASVAFAHGAAEVLEDLAVLTNLQVNDKSAVLCILAKLASSSEDCARVVFGSDALLNTIENTFYTTEEELVRETTCVLSNLRNNDSFDSLFAEFPCILDKVFIPAIARCLFHCIFPWHLSLVLRSAYVLFHTELLPDRKVAIEERIELSGLGQRKQREQLWVVDALWDREARSSRCEARVEDIAGRLRMYWGFLQGCWDEAQRRDTHGNNCSKYSTCLGFNEAVFLLYQEIREVISLLHKKRSREE